MSENRIVQIEQKHLFQLLIIASNPDGRCDNMNFMLKEREV